MLIAQVRNTESAPHLRASRHTIRQNNEAANPDVTENGSLPVPGSHDTWLQTIALPGNAVKDFMS